MISPPAPQPIGESGRKRGLRLQAYGDLLRALYAFDSTRSAVLLIGGNKTGKDKRFCKTMIPKTDAIYDEHSSTCNPIPSHDALIL